MTTQTARKNALDKKKAQEEKDILWKKLYEFDKKNPDATHEDFMKICSDEETLKFFYYCAGH